MPALTSLRAIAALLVFLYHFPPQGLGRLVDVVVGEGHVGVTVFFVLSGFLITVRYFPQFASGQARLTEYFVRRGARILPLYYVVLTLTYLFSSGSVPVDRAHLPEWTLTQALFGSSVEDVAIPTAWSLTVEECFYASAPLVYVAMAAFRRRLGSTLGTLVTLGLTTTAFHLIGSLIVSATATPAGGSPFPYLSDEGLLRAYTVFGRFPDFAVGAAAGVLFLSGRVQRAWQRRHGGLWSTMLALAGAALLVGAEAGMARDAASPAAVWRWNLVVVVASAAVVIALTCAHAPLSRLLSWRLPVYLGRISYALYLIQLTPLGNGLLYRILPGDDGVHIVALYVGMSLIAALLFELVEEPARETILTLWRRGRGAVFSPARRRWAGAVSLAIVLSTLAIQYALWALSSLAPIDHARVLAVLGSDAPDVVTATLDEPTDGREPRVRVPASWRVGPLGDRRAPRSLLVFVNGKPVPFLGARSPTGPDACAYYRRPRADFLSLQVEPPATLTVVNHSPPVALALAWSALSETPLLWIAPLVLLVGCGLAIGISRRSSLWTPRTTLTLAVVLVVAWTISGLHARSWAPWVVLLELVGLAWLAFATASALRARA